jgi:hypothetical protein
VVARFRLVLVALLLACSSSPAGSPANLRQKPTTPPTAATGGPCTLDGLEPRTDDDRVVLTNIARRCHPIDHCLLECMRSGCAANIGGGCFHTCSRIGAPAAERDRVLLEEARRYRARTHRLCRRAASARTMPPAEAPPPMVDDDRIAAFWEAKAEGLERVSLGPDEARERPGSGPCASHARTARVELGFAVDGAVAVEIRAELAPCARVVREGAGASITVSGRPSGGVGGYHGPPGWKATPAAAWGFSFDSRRHDQKLVISTVNEIEYIHHHYYLEDLEVRVPHGVSVVLVPRRLDGSGTPDLEIEPRVKGPE